MKFKQTRKKNIKQRGTRKYRNLKGGDRPSIDILKNINLLNSKLSPYLNPFIGCAYVELKIINTLFNIFKIPIDEPFLNKEDTQHHRAINILFKKVSDNIVPVHTLLDNDRLPVADLGRFIIIRYLWTIYPVEAIELYNEYIKESARYKKIDIQLTRNIEELKKNVKKYNEYTLKHSKLSLYLEKTEIKLNELMKTDKAINILSLITREPTNESLKPIKQFIPLETPINKYTLHLLLAILWWKCPTKAYFVEYYRAIKDILDIVLPSETFEIPADFAEIRFTDDDMITEGEAINEEHYFYLNYINYIKNTKGPQIQIIDYSKAKVYEDEIIQEFTDCGETTLRNFIRIFIYNNATLEYDLSLLERWGATDEIIKYFKEFNIEEKQLSLSSRNEWARLLSMREGIEYNKPLKTANRCEIKSNIENSMKLLQQMFKNIENITDFNNGNLTIQKYDDYILSLDESKKETFISSDNFVNSIFIIIYDDIPIYIWKDTGSHSEIISTNYNITNLRISKIYIPYKYTDKNELSQYGDSIVMKYTELINNYEDIINPYIFSQSYIYIYSLMNEIYPVFSEDIYDIADYSIVISINYEEYKSIISKFHEEVWGMFDINFMNIKYIINNSDILDNIFTYDDEHLIKRFKYTITYELFKQLEADKIISKEFDILNINFGKNEIKIHNVLDTYNKIHTIVCNNLYLPITGIDNLIIMNYEPRYVDNTLKHLTITSTFSIEDIELEMFPSSLESLTLVETYHETAELSPSIQTFTIGKSINPIEKEMIPSTVKNVYFGISKNEFVKKDYYFSSEIKSLNEGIEHIEIFNKDIIGGIGYRNKIRFNALPKTIKSIHINNITGMSYKYNLDKRVFKEWREDIQISKNIDII